MEFSEKMYDLEAVIEDLRNILIHGLTPSITVPIVNTLQKKKILYKKDQDCNQLNKTFKH